MKATLQTPYGTLQNLRVEYAEEVLDLIGRPSTDLVAETRSKIRVQHERGDALYILDNGKYRLALIRHYSTAEYYISYYNFGYVVNSTKWYCRMIGESAESVYNGLGISCAHLFIG